MLHIFRVSITFAEVSSTHAPLCLCPPSCSAAKKNKFYSLNKLVPLCLDNASAAQRESASGNKTCGALICAQGTFAQAKTAAWRFEGDQAWSSWTHKLYWHLTRNFWLEGMQRGREQGEGRWCTTRCIRTPIKHMQQYCQRRRGRWARAVGACVCVCVGKLPGICCNAQIENFCRTVRAAV